MEHPAWGRGGRMGVQVGVEPDQADGTSLGDCLGSTLPGSDGAAVVTSKHQGLVAPADALGDRCCEAFRVMSNGRSGGYQTRTSGGGAAGPQANDFDCAVGCSIRGLVD